MKNKTKLQRLLFALIGLGVGVRIFQFIYNRSLWYDEATLALNIVEKDFTALTAPLEYNQVAPILYLFLQKGLTLTFGNHDFVLRISSLLGGILLLYLSFRLGKLILNKSTALIATAILGLSYPLVYYSTEAKPYILDTAIFVGLFICYFKSKNDKNWQIVFAILAPISIWFSFSSIIVLAAIALFSFFEKRIFSFSQNQLIGFFSMHLPWVLSFGLNYYFIIAGHDNTSQMTTFWEQHFMPSVWPLDTFLTWQIKHFAQLFYVVLGFGKWFSVLPIGLFLFGLFKSVKEKNYKIGILLLPIILHLFLSFFQIYPFAERLVLYNAFSIAIIIAYGIIGQNQFNLPIIKKIVLVGIFFNLTFQTSIKIPIEREDAKSIIEFLNKNAKPNDHLYIYYGAVPAMKFYREKLHFQKDKITFGNEYRNAPEKYFEEIIKSKGTTWLVFTHFLESEVLQIKRNFYEKGTNIVFNKVLESKNEKIFLIQVK